MTGKLAPMSTYAQGFQGGVNVRGANVGVNHPGKVFWVGDGTTAGATPAYPNRKTPSDGNKGTFLAPFKTADKAVEQCTAEAGDIIRFLPGYSENVESATSLVLDVDGIQLIGMGEGTDQARLNYDTETASVLLSGANCVISGLHLQNSDTSEATAAALIVSGAGNEISGNRFTNSDVDTNEWVSIVDIEAVANTKVLDNNVEQSNATVAAVAMVQLNGACTDTEVRDNKCSAAFTKGMVQALTTASVNTTVKGNEFISGGVDALDAIPLVDDEVATTSGSGLVYDNLVVGTAAQAVSTAGTETYFISDNKLAKTAGTEPLDSNGQLLLKSFVTAAVEIEAEAALAVASVESGTVALWGMQYHAITAAGAAAKFGMGTEQLGVAAIQLQTDVDLNVAGDTGYATEAPGGAQSVTEAAAAPSNNHIWDYPIYITGDDEIDIVDGECTAGGDGAFTFYYLPVTAGAVIVAAE